INLVFMGDGYVTSEIPQFLKDVDSVVTYIFSKSPFNSYKNFFNVFAIKCVAPQSGVTPPGTATDVPEPASPVMSVNNYFNTRFDNYNTHRLIYSNNTGAINFVLSNYFPN